MNLHEQLAVQREQEAQMTNELETLLNRFAEEYAVTKYQVAALLPFGYRLNEQSTQLRLPFDEVVEFISDYPTNPIPKLLKEREEARCE